MNAQMPVLPICIKQTVPEGGFKRYQPVQQVMETL